MYTDTQSTGVYTHTPGLMISVYTFSLCSSFPSAFHHSLSLSFLYLPHSGACLSFSLFHASTLYASTVLIVSVCFRWKTADFCCVCVKGKEDKNVEICNSCLV